MLYPPVAISLLSPLFADGWLAPTLSEWGVLIGVGLFMNTGQFFMTKGYAIESAGPDQRGGHPGDRVRAHVGYDVSGGNAGPVDHRRRAC